MSDPRSLTMTWHSDRITGSVERALAVTMATEQEAKP